MRSLIFVVSLLCVVNAQSEEPQAACRAQVSVEGISEVLGAIAPELVDAITEVDIEDIKGRTKVAVVGKIDYKLKKIDIQDASYSAINIDLPGKIDFGIDGMRIKVKADWSFEKVGFPWVPFGSGRLTATISKSDIHVGISTGVNDIGQPTAVIDSVNINLRDVDITISGSWFSWLYNFLLWLFDGAVKNALKAAIHDIMTENFNDYIEEMLGSIPTTFPINDNLVLDYSLTEAPEYVTDPTSLVVSLLGEFHDPIDYKPAPFPHADFDSHLPIPGDARLWLDQFILNSFLFTVYENGQLAIDIRDGDPVDIGVGFNTNDWLVFIPRLPLRYPNRPIELHVEAADQPLVVVSHDYAELDADIFISFMVVVSDDKYDRQLEEAFKLRANFRAALDADVESTPEDTRLTMKLHHAKFDLSVETSKIGDFTVDVLNTFIQAVFDEILLPIVNVVLAEGVELPQMDGLVLVNPDIKFEDMYIAIDTEVKYEIPDEMRERVRAKQHARSHFRQISSSDEE